MLPMFVIACLTSGAWPKPCCGMVGCVGLPYLVKAVFIQKHHRDGVGEAGHFHSVEAHNNIITICSFNY